MLRAMRAPVDCAMGTVRISLGQMTTETEIEESLEAIVRTVRRLRPTA
jgi:cysteine sulfinate desulfinase/cysteine desulfurase-like protein